MEEKYFLTESDIKNLSIEQQDAYNNFMKTINDRGIVYKEQLEKFDEILKSQYSNHVLFNPNSMERYLEILAKNLESVISAIVDFRNDVINERRDFNLFHFQNVLEGLDVLTEFINKYLKSYHYGNSFGDDDLKSLLPIIQQLKDQIHSDLQYFQGYKEEKSKARVDFEAKKEAYDRLSMFGKIAAVVNGKKKELDEATRKYAYYGSVKTAITKPTNIDNPYQYEEYIESQQNLNEGVKTK